ncbi:MAG: flagellar biosynthetic protein FliQ [Deltaproteobacteria bacterium]|nr:flagellar biosynthetic protein FliQ [Deltaproteobacteria bacterium]
MVEDFIIQVANEGILVLLIISGPPILFSLSVGLMISLFQAVTQIQEQSLTFVPKLIVVFGTLAILGPTLASMMADFARICLDGFASVVGR